VGVLGSEECEGGYPWLSVSAASLCSGLLNAPGPQESHEGHLWAP